MFKSCSGLRGLVILPNHSIRECFGWEGTLKLPEFHFPSFLQPRSQSVLRWGLACGLG